MQKHGNDYFDPIHDQQWQKRMYDQEMLLVGDQVDNDLDDMDSQDSNREDHSNNEYPDDEEGLDNDDGYKSSSSYGSERHRKRRDSDDYDSEDSDGRNGRQFLNSKQANIQLKNSIFDKIFKKNKEWSFQNHQAQMKDTGFLDDYDNDGGKTYKEKNKYYQDEEEDIDML